MRQVERKVGTMTPEDKRLIVQVQWGPLAFQKALVRPGQTLRVGRAESNGLAIAHDEGMASSHFELAWDGKACQVRAVEGVKEILLDEQSLPSAEASNASWLRAGTTDFVLYVEGFTPAAEQETADGAVLHGQVLQALRKQEGPLFAVMDAAQDPRILVLLRESVEQYHSHYEGPQGLALADVAPYLVSLPKESRLLEALVREGWGKS